MTYWTAEHQADVFAYLNGAKVTRRLAEVLYEIASRSLTSLGVADDEEVRQEIVVHLYSNVLPRLTLDKAGGSLQYLWMAARNFALSNRPAVVPDTVEDIPERVYDEDDEGDRRALQRRILEEIDLRLRGQRIANCTNAVFLMFLRRYVLENDFDVRGFGDYVRGQMHLTLSAYRAVCSRLGLRTMQFNETKPVEDARRVVAIRDGLGVIYPGVRQASRILGVDRANLRDCLRGGRKTVGGYKFVYLSNVRGHLN
jgi:hypothetical protein